MHINRTEYVKMSLECMKMFGNDQDCQNEKQFQFQSAILREQLQFPNVV